MLSLVHGHMPCVSRLTGACVCRARGLPEGSWRSRSCLRWPRGSAGCGGCGGGPGGADRPLVPPSHRPAAARCTGRDRSSAVPGESARAPCPCTSSSPCGESESQAGARGAGVGRGDVTGPGSCGRDGESRGLTPGWGARRPSAARVWEGPRGRGVGGPPACPLSLQDPPDLSRRRGQVRPPAHESRLSLPGAGGLRPLPTGAPHVCAAGTFSPPHGSAPASAPRASCETGLPFLSVARSTHTARGPAPSSTRRWRDRACPARCERV